VKEESCALDDLWRLKETPTSLAWGWYGRVNGRGVSLMRRLPSSTVTSMHLDDLSGLSGTSQHLFLIGVVGSARWLIDLLARWLVDSLARWLVGSLAHWLVDSLACWLVGSLALLDRTSAAAFKTVSLVNSRFQPFALFYYTIE
jgi:hypothetical protein